MAIHPNKEIVATGQMASKELTDKTIMNKGRQALKQGKLVNIHIWSATTRELIVTLRGLHRRAVNHLEFSPNGDKLITVGADDNHTIAIYDWANNVVLGSTGGNPDALYDVAWKNNNEFAVVGVKLFSNFTQ